MTIIKQKVGSLYLFESVLFYCLLIYASLIPFQYISSSVNLYGVNLTLLRYIPFLISFLLVCILLLKLILKKVTLPSGKIFPAMILMIIWSFLSIFSSSNILYSLSHYAYYTFTGILLAFVVYFICDNLRNISHLITLIIALAAVMSLIGIAEYFFLKTTLFNTVFSLENFLYSKFIDAGGGGYFRSSSRIISTIGHPNPLAFSMIPGVIFCLMRFVNSEKPAGRISYGGLTLILLLGLLLTFSRGGWIACAAAMLLYFIKNKTKYTKLLLGAALIIMPLFFLSPDVRNTFLKRTDVPGEISGQANRKYSYFTAANISSKAPLWGVGVANFRWVRGNFDEITYGTIDSPDNFYLMTLSETGIIGLIIFVSLIQFLYRGCAFKKNTNTEISENQEWAFVCIMIGLIINLLFFDALYHPVPRMLFWSITGVFASLIYRSDEVLLKTKD